MYSVSIELWSTQGVAKQKESARETGSEPEWFFES